MNGHYLDLDNWPRRAHFNFFRAYELPFFGICAEVPVTKTLQLCKEHKLSFSLACWYACSMAIHDIPEFRYRIRGERVWVHDRLDIGTTILNDNETFRFCYYPYRDSFQGFAAAAKEVKKALLVDSEASMNERTDNDAVIHGSTLPWVRFTGLNHARRLGTNDSVPKIAFGRYAQSQGEYLMPVNVDVHHALLDGLHASRFFGHLEARFADPKWLLI
jgi:chloramphenicol O-acetyltransferase type A